MSQSRELEYARMHTTIFAPSIGQLGPELSATSSSYSKATKMTLEDGVVVCDVKTKDGKSATVLIPLANFTNMVLKRA